MRTSSVFVLALLLAGMLLIPGVSADPAYDVTIWSEDYQPGHVVTVNITGLANSTFSVRITDPGGNILAGKDAALNVTGQYVFGWTPSQDGDYNATVTFANNLVVTRKFLIQQKVTPAQIGDLYRSLFALQDRLLKLIEELRTLTYVAVGLAVVSVVVTAGLVNYARKRVSPAETEFAGFMKEDVESAIQKLAKRKP